MDKNNYKGKLTTFDFAFALICIKKYATFKYGNTGIKAVRIYEIIKIFTEFSFTWYNELTKIEAISLFFKAFNRIYAESNIEKFEQRLKATYKRDYDNAENNKCIFY